MAHITASVPDMWNDTSSRPVISCSILTLSMTTGWRGPSTGPSAAVLWQPSAIHFFVLFVARDVDAVASRKIDSPVTINVLHLGTVGGDDEGANLEGILHDL